MPLCRISCCNSSAIALDVVKKGKNCNFEEWRYLDVGGKSWDKRKQETSKAFAAFCLYRDMPPFERSMEEVRKLLGKPSGYLRQLEAWSSKYEWVKRAHDWDTYLDKQTEQQRIAAWKGFQEDAITYIRGLMAKGAMRIRDIDLDDIPATALSKWLVDTHNVFSSVIAKPGENKDDATIINTDEDADYQTILDAIESVEKTE